MRPFLLPLKHLKSDHRVGTLILSIIHNSLTLCSPDDEYIVILLCNT